jgi:hypothetical protein
MSTPIFNFKVTYQKNEPIKAAELIECIYESPNRSFMRPWANANGVGSETVPRSLSPVGFVEALHELHRQKGDPFFQKTIDGKKEAMEQLRKSYEEKSTDALFHPELLIWNNLFAELGIPGFTALPASRLRISIAQVEGGIEGFPKHNGLGVKSRFYREFLIRILSDIDMPGWPQEKNPLVEWCRTHRVDMNTGRAQVDFGSHEAKDEGIIWGLGEIATITIEPHNEEFWKTHADTWWAQNIKNKLMVGDENYPLKVIDYEILIHPAWFKEEGGLAAASKIHDSTAY